jgi:hypothetical protein
MTKRSELPEVINIDVRAVDIAKGKRLQSGCCPIALAVHRCCRTDDVEVDIDFVRVGETYYESPALFIYRFDSRLSVRPSRFALERLDIEVI